MFARVRKWLLVLSLLGSFAALSFQWLQYRLDRDLLPAGTAVAAVDVSGLTIEEARRKVVGRYLKPLYLYHREEHVELDPQNVGFTMDMDTMFGRLLQLRSEQDELVGFASYLIHRPLRPISVPLAATHDRNALLSVLESIAEFLDRPTPSPRFLAKEGTVLPAQNGYVTDVEASLMDAEAALYRLEDRVVQMTVIEQEAPSANLELLADVIDARLQAFDGLGSIFVMDLQTGEEVGINADVALSGLSILKIAVFVEAYRALDGQLNEHQQRLFFETAARSSNFSANLLLHIVAGEENTYRGADILTRSMQRLGLINTFMAVPYDASAPAHRQTTYRTPANSRLDLSSEPDPTMQTTAEEIGTLLAMIYDCAEDGGALLAAYPEQITPEECQAILDLMILNEEGNLIRFGVPPGTPVSHKHGWALGTHADAGIVFSPGGDYVIVEYLYQPGTWLVADESFPVLREISRAVYNYFNYDNPYLVDTDGDRGLIDPGNPFSEN